MLIDKGWLTNKLNNKKVARQPRRQRQVCAQWHHCRGAAYQRWVACRQGNHAVDWTIYRIARRFNLTATNGALLSNVILEFNIIQCKNKRPAIRKKNSSRAATCDNIIDVLNARTWNDCQFSSWYTFEIQLLAHFNVWQDAAKCVRLAVNDPNEFN